jgi:protein TonB
MMASSSVSPKSGQAIGLSVTIAVHVVLAVLLLVQFRSALPPILPEPVPIKLLNEAPKPKPELKPLPVPNAVVHPPVPVPVLVVPLLTVAEQPKPELPKIERSTAITLPPPAPPPAAPPQSDTRVLDFQSKLMAHLNSLKRYPAEARRQGKAGVVMVRFRIDRHGHVLSYHIEQGSGHVVLDEETSRLMQRADPVPAPPDEVPGAELEFVVPVQYKLG